MKKAKFGYCSLTADFLHYGHINFIKKCKAMCENLTVGVMTDDAVKKYKKNKPIMKAHYRMELLKSLSYVDRVVYQNEFEFGHEILRLKEFHGKDFLIFDSIEHKRKNADVFFPRTKNISSTYLKRIISENSNYSLLQV